MSFFKILPVVGALLVASWLAPGDADSETTPAADELATGSDAPSSAGKKRPSGAPEDLLTKGKPLYSQFKEELYVRHFFDDMRDGVYVDVGAWEWEKNSTTAYLEKHLGWSGIAIDAQPGLAAGWAAHRPRAKFFPYIVTDHAGTQEPFYLTYGLSSTDPEHIKQWKALREKKQRVALVETVTLDDLLTREGVERIDFLSMDIEGGEPKALAGFDIKRFRPRLVCIEAGLKGSKRRAEIAAYFEKHGYRRIKQYESRFDPNWYLTPEDDPASQ